MEESAEKRKGRRVIVARTHYIRTDAPLAGIKREE